MRVTVVVHDMGPGKKHKNQTFVVVEVEVGDPAFKMM